jgi:hypothetical protein
MSQRRGDWPQEIRKVELANFKPDRFAAQAAPQKWRANRTGMSEGHLNLLRKLPCSVCELRAHHAHHLRSGAAAKERGVSLKATDRWAVGLCWLHHDEVHRSGSRFEPAWFARWGINPHALATAMWANTGDLPRMGRVLIAHKQDATRSLKLRAQVGALMRHGLTRAEAEEQYAAGLWRRP